MRRLSCSASAMRFIPVSGQGVAALDGGLWARTLAVLHAREWIVQAPIQCSALSGAEPSPAHVLCPLQFAVAKGRS